LPGGTKENQDKPIARIGIPKDSNQAPPEQKSTALLLYQQVLH
jgi:hypothetical protein